MLQTAALAVFLSVSVYVARLYIQYRETVRSVNDFPGRRVLYHNVSNLNRIFGDIPYIGIGIMYALDNKFEVYKKLGNLAYVHISPITTPPILIGVADPEAAKEILSNRSKWPKPWREYKAVSFYGPNIIATEDDEWKKHKKAAGPAFTEPNNKYVCSATVGIMNDLFETVWSGRNEISVDDVKHLTTDIALLVIARAAFGRSISWDEDKEISSGCTMSFKESLTTVNNGIFVKAILPEWSYNLHPKLKHTRNAFEDLHKYIQGMIDSRKAEGVSEGRSDLLSLLIKASEDEKTDAKLSDEEIISDSFIFMLAGHETTSHTLAYALGLLSLYPDEQEKLFQHVKSVLSDGRDPTYEDLSKLTRVLAVIYETLRLFPALPEIPKDAAEDTTIKIRSLDGTTKILPVPKGTRIHVSCVGLHYNPELWEDPHEFRPERFNEDWPRDAFIPFSGGPRACIGRRFSETEAVAILSMLVMKYEMKILDEPKFAHETFEEKKERVFRTEFHITLTPLRIPIVFTRRA